MNVTRLRLENFKRHRELDVALAPGLNVVRGANEAGKSTLQRAIEMILFRKATFASTELDELRSWGDAEADPVVELEFEDDGRRGALRKTFAGSRGTVELRFGDEVLTDAAAVEQRVAELTGLSSEKFFRATASVHHQDVADLDQDEATLRDRLQQSISGADRGVRATRKKLEDAIRRYKSEGAKNPGYLKVHRSEVERLQAEVREGETALAQLEEDRRALAAARVIRLELDARLAEQRTGLERAERAATLAARALDATRKYTMYKRAAELEEEIDALEATHPSSVPLAALRAAIESLRNLEFKLSEMRAELAAEPDLSAYDVAITTPRWRPWLALSVVLGLAAALAAAVGIVSGAAVVGVAVALAAGIGALLAGARTISERRRLGDVRMQNELRESEIARRLAGRTDLAERVRQAEQERVQALGVLDVTHLAAAERMLAAEADHTAQINAKRAEYRGTLGEEPAGQDVAALRDRAAAEADECRHTLAGMGEMGEQPDRFVSAYQTAVDRLGPERDAAFEAEAQAEARVNANGVDAETVAAAAESLRAAEESLAAAERRLRIYEDVLATLDKSERATMKKAARFLEQRMAGDLERITGGRYRRLRIDEATLTFSVYSPELDDWVDIRRLSQGTLDQLYVCARLGIVRQVSEPASPPLVFDDPFVTFDEERAARALELLKEIATDFQVIYLTCSDRYDAVADHVVVLVQPTEMDTPATPPPASGESISMWSSAALPPMPAAPVSGGNGSTNGRPQPAVTAAPDTHPATPAAEPAPLWPEER